MEQNHSRGAVSAWSSAVWFRLAWGILVFVLLVGAMSELGARALVEDEAPMVFQGPGLPRLDPL